MAMQWTEVQRRAQARDIERQIRYNSARKAVAARLPALLPEYLKVLLGAMIGFWLISAALGLLGARPIYTYAVLGLVFSLQATWYKRQLARDPNFRVKRCNCGGVRKDSTETVLSSSASTMLGVPNSVLGALLYSGLIVLLYRGEITAALIVALAAALVSAWLAYVMIIRIKGLCSTCINIAALNIWLVMLLVNRV